MQPVITTEVAPAVRNHPGAWPTPTKEMTTWPRLLAKREDPKDPYETGLAHWREQVRGARGGPARRATGRRRSRAPRPRAGARLGTGLLGDADASRALLPRARHDRSDGTNRVARTLRHHSDSGQESPGRVGSSPLFRRARASRAESAGTESRRPPARPLSLREPKGIVAGASPQRARLGAHRQRRRSSRARDTGTNASRRHERQDHRPLLVDALARRVLGRNAWPCFGRARRPARSLSMQRHSQGHRAGRSDPRSGRTMRRSRSMIAPIGAVRPPRKPPLLPKPLELEEAQKLLAVAVAEGGRRGIAVMLALLLGLRRFEIAELRFADFSNGWVRIVGKCQRDASLCRFPSFS